MVTENTHNCAYIVINQWAKKTVPPHYSRSPNPFERPQLLSNAISIAKINPQSKILSSMHKSHRGSPTSALISSDKSTGRPRLDSRKRDLRILKSWGGISRRSRGLALNFRRDCRLPSSHTSIVCISLKVVHWGKNSSICFLMPTMLKMRLKKRLVWPNRKKWFW